MASLLSANGRTPECSGDSLLRRRATDKPRVWAGELMRGRGPGDQGRGSGSRMSAGGAFSPGAGVRAAGCLPVHRGRARPSPKARSGAPSVAYELSVPAWSKRVAAASPNARRDAVSGGRAARSNASRQDHPPTESLRVEWTAKPLFGPLFWPPPIGTSNRNAVLGRHRSGPAIETLFWTTIRLKAGPERPILVYLSMGPARSDQFPGFC